MTFWLSPLLEARNNMFCFENKPPGVICVYLFTNVASLERLMLAHLKDITANLLDPLQGLQTEDPPPPASGSPTSWWTGSSRWGWKNIQHLLSYSCCPPGMCGLPTTLFPVHNNCTSSVKVLKFADNATVIGHIRDDDESAYRRVVDQPVNWCSLNKL